MTIEKSLVSIRLLLVTESRPSESKRKILRLSFSIYIGRDQIQRPRVHALREDETLN